VNFSIAIEPPRAPGVDDLLRQGDEYAFSLYPPESCYLLDVATLERPEVTVFVGRDAAGFALGMAAIVDRGDGTAELKRLFVDDRARGLGLAVAILGSLESDAVHRGINRLELETGPLQHAAIALYGKLGYERIPNFGQYVGDQYSVCFAKELSSERSQALTPGSLAGS
jgi:putative acetyltransferase